MGGGDFGGGPLIEGWGVSFGVGMGLGLVGLTSEVPQ